MVDGDGNVHGARRPELKRTSNPPPPLLPSTGNSTRRTRTTRRTSEATQHGTTWLESAAPSGSPWSRVRVWKRKVAARVSSGGGRDFIGHNGGGAEAVARTWRRARQNARCRRCHGESARRLQVEDDSVVLQNTPWSFRKFQKQLKQAPASCFGPIWCSFIRRKVPGRFRLYNLVHTNLSLWMFL